MDPVDEFLQHYGRLGMKWGVRKDRSGGGDGGSSKAHRRRSSPDFKEARAIRKKKHKALTNEEIKKANERANLEKNFTKLNPGKVERGRLRVEGALAIAATAGGVYALTKSPHGQAFITKFLVKNGAKVVV